MLPHKKLSSYAFKTHPSVKWMFTRVFYASSSSSRRDYEWENILSMQLCLCLHFEDLSYSMKDFFSIYLCKNSQLNLKITYHTNYLNSSVLNLPFSFMDFIILTYKCKNFFILKLCYENISFDKLILKNWDEIVMHMSQTYSFLITLRL